MNNILYIRKMNNSEQNFETFQGENWPTSCVYAEYATVKSDPVKKRRRGGENKNVKRRKNDPSKWKHNARKKMLASGIEHVNTANKMVKKRETGPDCQCKYKCFEKFNEDEKQKLIRQFNAIGEKNLQDTYLLGLISSVPVKPPRVSKKKQENNNNGSNSLGSPETSFNVEASTSVDDTPVKPRRQRKCANTYRIRIACKNERVCKTAFGSLHGIFRKRVERLAAIACKGDVFSPIDMRGRHTNRPRAVSDDVVQKIDDFIRNLMPKRRKKNPGSELTVSQMHSLFANKYNNDEKASKVTLDFFSRYFKANF